MSNNLYPIMLTLIMEFVVRIRRVTIWSGIEGTTEKCDCSIERITEISGFNIYGISEIVVVTWHILHMRKWDSHIPIRISESKK